MNLELSLTEQCNLRCSYCYYKETHEQRAAVMSDEVIRAAVDLAIDKVIKQDDDFLNITFFGGEPLLRIKAIRDTVKYAKKVVKQRKKDLPEDFFLHFSINTNGTLLSEELLDYFEKEKFQIALSLDGPKKQHDIARKTINGKGSFESILPFIPRLSQMDAIILSVITREHVKGLAQSIKWIFRQGFKTVTTSVDFDGKWTGEQFDDLILEYQKLADFWKVLQKKDKNLYLGTIQDKISLELSESRLKNTGCFISKDALVVATNGSAFPCTRFISSKPKAPYVLGNVLDKDSGIHKGRFPRAVAHFIKHDKTVCDDCAIKYRCQAHECGCTSYYTTGSLEGVSAEVCTHERILCAICDDAYRDAYMNTPKTSKKRIK